MPAVDSVELSFSVASFKIASKNIRSKYEYLERIFFDAILNEATEKDNSTESTAGKYEVIGDYNIKDYVERPHEYVEK